MMKSTPLYLDVHILQNVPPSNINRDDTGSPKTARFGGVVRARVSSQAWKKVTRDAFASVLDTSELGQRTTHAVDMIAESIMDKDSDIAFDEARALASSALEAAGIKVSKPDNKHDYPFTGYLLFVGARQADGLASLAIEAKEKGSAVEKKAAKAILDIKQNPALNAIDVALFGRMVADAPDLNVDASVQVAHAIGIDRAETEFDYFTAVDDRAPEDNAGATMIGTNEFTSSTFYRYATVDVSHLYENLGSSLAAQKAAEAFLSAFITSMPTGKQNTFANRTLPSVVVAQFRETQPVSLVNAFEVPVSAKKGESQIRLACKALVKQEKLLDEAFGVDPIQTYVVCACDDADVFSEIAPEGTIGLKELVKRAGEKIGSFLDEREGSSDR
jgi:CRISPR system Cascade subunit CasC